MICHKHRVLGEREEIRSAIQEDVIVVRTVRGKQIPDDPVAPRVTPLQKSIFDREQIDRGRKYIEILDFIISAGRTRHAVRDGLDEMKVFRPLEPGR